MNALTLHCQLAGLDANAVMDALQGAGVVSDNAVTTEDVALADVGRALEWIKDNPVKI